MGPHQAGLLAQLYIGRVRGVSLSRRPSPQTIRVLGALASRPEQWRHGYELAQEVDLKSGSLYPILMRLCDRGCLEACWETDAPLGRPARHLYRLTPSGVTLAAEWVPAAALLPARRSRTPHVGLGGAW